MAGLLLGVLAPMTSTAVGRPAARVGTDPFTPGAAYHGGFPDPTVWRVGGRFYAASTTQSSVSLPISSSTDLRTWTARPASDADRPEVSDALATPASWAKLEHTLDGRAWVRSWAPSVLRLSDGTFVAAYSVPRALDGRRCLSLARSRSPMGPYVDSTSAPLVCGQGNVIDPQLFADRGVVWLLYKMAGSPTLVVVRAMNASATGFAAGSRGRVLLSPRKTWEGAVVENPAMIRFHRRIYLFYSANAYDTTRYATGYAICKTVVGPCRRSPRLLVTGSVLAGPGGATPFVDLAGQLRLAYHAWRVDSFAPSNPSCASPSLGCAQRRLYVATLGVARKGRLVLRRMY